MRVGIFHTAFIGDVTWLGLLVEGLWQAGHEVVVITKPACVELFENDERVQTVLKVKKQKGLKKILSIQKIGSQLEALSLDILLCAHRSLTSALIGAASGIKKRIGFSTAAGGFLYSELRPWDGTVHESLRYLNLAPDWLVPAAVQNELRLYGRSILKAKHNLGAFSEKFPEFFSTVEPYFVVSPGSVWATKKYSVSHLADVVVELLATYPQHRCVINGGPGDESDVGELVNFLKKQNESMMPRIFNGLGLLSVGDMVSLLRRADFSISNDSGPAHVANAVNCPVVAIYGPTPIDTGLVPVGQLAEIVQFNKLHPHSKLACQPCSAHGQKQCPLGHHRCMTDVPARVVVGAVKTLLEKRDFYSVSEGSL